MKSKREKLSPSLSFKKLYVLPDSLSVYSYMHITCKSIFTLQLSVDFIYAFFLDLQEKPISIVIHCRKLQ
jgi:hypothetical protein